MEYLSSFFIAIRVKMKKDYLYDLDMKLYGDGEVVFEKGLGQANIHIPDFPREFDNVDQKLFPILREQGIIEYGSGSKWDDRKYRLNEPQIGGGKIVVPMGLTYFGAVKTDIDRIDRFNSYLKELGEKLDGDEWMFFSRAIGAAFIPITTDGCVFIGQRVGEMYNGWLNAVAGNVDFHGDPSLHKFGEVAEKELNEEYGVDLKVLDKMRFAGIASHSIRGDADAVFVGRVNVSSDYFKSGKWIERRKDKEHAPDLVSISSVKERDKLLIEGKLENRNVPGIMYSTRLGLEYLTERDFIPL